MPVMITGVSISYRRGIGSNKVSINIPYSIYDGLEWANVRAVA